MQNYAFISDNGNIFDKKFTLSATRDKIQTFSRIAFFAYNTLTTPPDCDCLLLGDKYQTFIFFSTRQNTNTFLHLATNYKHFLYIGTRNPITNAPFSLFATNIKHLIFVICRRRCFSMVLRGIMFVFCREGVCNLPPSLCNLSPNVCNLSRNV